MKRVLTWLTLLTTGAIVSLLVAYLVPTALLLIQANRNLAKLIRTLEGTRANTARLGQDLPAVNDATARLHNQTMAVGDRLSTIAQALRQ